MTRRIIAFTAALAAVMLLTTTLWAQTSTTGSLSGAVRDENGEGLAGVTVVATDQRTGTQYSEITEENGSYTLRSLIPGDYNVSFFYADITKVAKNVSVRLGKQQPLFTTIDTTKAGGEVIEVEGKAPAIDLGSTKQGISISDDYTRNIPVPGRTYASTLGAAAGSQGDLYGVSFSGSSSLENNYVVDGINTTGLNFGTVGSFLVNEFIQETEIITGGYNAEFGRATGGVVNVVTKTGTNEFRGSVFSYLQPGALTAGVDLNPVQGTPIVVQSNLSFDTDFGFELGGPIVKDKAWFYVGFAPRLVRTNNERIVRRQTDCRDELPGGGLTECDPEAFGDQQPDVDPNTGLIIYDEIERRNLVTSLTSFQFLSKVNFAVTPEHQGQVTLSGTPLIGSFLGAGGSGEASARDLDNNALTTDFSAKWSSKLNNNKTELETQVGVHRVTREINSSIDSANALAREDILFGNLQDFAGNNRESELVQAQCADGGANDPFPLIANCPFRINQGYAIGGPGGVVDDLEQRVVWRATAAHRVKAAGQHLLKAGADVELNNTEVPRQFTGGAFYQNRRDANVIIANRFARLGETGQNVCGTRVDDLGVSSNIPCDFIEGASPVTGETVNWSAFAQDSWDILPNLTVNAGIRYEEQRLRYSKELQNTTDPVTGDELGTNALVLRNNWAPRAGLIWDWTKEGRSKVYGSWGRFYQNVPMRINERSFGGETTVIQTYDTDQCGMVDETIGSRSGNGCDPMETPGQGTQLFGAGTIIAPGVRAQYLDEFSVGAEYELFEDLVVGISYQDRRLGRVIEDVSVDGGFNYIIANPGETSVGGSELDALQAQIDALPTGDPNRDRLQGELDQLEQYRRVGTSFPKATRNYQAIQLTARKRFSRNLFFQGSYTYSRTRGNFPGLFSPDTGQLDPNITSQFDLIELLANREGPLPQDRPHLFNLDAYYQHELPGNWGDIGGGMSARLGSGVPVEALGRHFRYGFNESYLLPRGAFGRTEFQHQLDVKFQYGKPLDKGRYRLEAFVDIFNLVNNQGEILVDETYTADDANPIVGGDKEDLVFAKQTDTQGRETERPIRPQLNFRNTAAFAQPLRVRFGLRFSF